MNIRLFSIMGFILAAALTRLIPHPWNFTAIGAMALFGGAYFQSRTVSLVVPMATLLLTDLILGFHPTMVFVYGAFALTVMLGWTFQEKKSVVRLGSYSLVASSLFFVLTNFGVWLLEPMYAKTFAGLAECFVLAIPFFGNQIVGDLFFCGLLFGSLEWARASIPALTRVR